LFLASEFHQFLLIFHAWFCGFFPHLPFGRGLAGGGTTRRQIPTQSEQGLWFFLAGIGGRQAKHKEDTATQRVNIIMSLCDTLIVTLPCY
jgi:hypothetical protein